MLNEHILYLLFVRARRLQEHVAVHASSIMLKYLSSPDVTVVHSSYFCKVCWSGIGMQDAVHLALYDT